MAFLDRLYGPQFGQLQLSLDRASERQAMLTKNIANINTPGYKREDIDFAIHLDRATLIRKHEIGGKASIQAPSLRSDGNNVDMERELLGLAETESRFNVLVEMTTRNFSNLRRAIREGR